MMEANRINNFEKYYVRATASFKEIFLF